MKRKITLYALLLFLSVLIIVPIMMKHFPFSPDLLTWVYAYTDWFSSIGLLFLGILSINMFFYGLNKSFFYLGIGFLSIGFIKPIFWIANFKSISFISIFIGMFFKLLAFVFFIFAFYEFWRMNSSHKDIVLPPTQIGGK